MSAAADSDRAPAAQSAGRDARPIRLYAAKGRQPDERSRAEVRALIGAPPPEGHRRDQLLEFLHRIQDAHGALRERHLVALAAEMRLSMTEVYEVATFYHHFEVVADDAVVPALTVRVCTSLSCCLAGANELLAAARARLASAAVRVVEAPCIGRCEQAPATLVGQRAVTYASVDALAAIITAGAAEAAPQSIGYARYCAGGGYALARAVASGERGAEDLIATLEHAGLRGMGGAGFPLGRKWRIVRAQPAPRHLVVNIDEGEPGTFKDRWLLERDPHRMLEGALIAAAAIGVEKVWLYLRDEYPELRTLLTAEIAALEADPPCPLPAIELRRGAGAYICGEESALLESIEGRRGEPRLRPPYIAEVGLFGRPTLEHNPETLYWVREIVERGPEWFASQGRRGRKGLRRFSVSGRVREPGVKLAPAGITLRELVDEYCGGMAEGHELYAYLPGGASGGILPAALADLPLDFDTLQPHGSFIGSAGVIVLGHQDRARDAALAMMHFFAAESCGQCTPCRVGTAKAAVLMAREQWDRPLLDDLSQVMADASICGLGQSAPNPLRSVWRHFPHEMTGGAP